MSNYVSKSLPVLQNFQVKVRKDTLIKLLAKHTGNVSILH